MFQKGDYIIYRNTGVCQVSEIGVPENFPITEGKLYYFLVPMRGSGTIYIPTDSPVFMRAVITPEQADTRLYHLTAAYQEHSQKRLRTHTKRKAFRENRYSIQKTSRTDAV